MAEIDERGQHMSGRAGLSLFTGSLKDRLTDPSVVTLQLVTILIPFLIVRQFGLISVENPVLALLVVPLLTCLSLYLPVGLIQDVTLKIEEPAGGDDDVFSCWQSISTRLIIWVNATVVVPMLIWELPIFGTLGYTAEAATELIVSESVTADPTPTGILLIGSVLVGGALTALGLLVSVKMFVGPNLAHDRIQMYLGLRSSLRSSGSESLAPLRDGGYTSVETTTLAHACVKYTLTRAGSEELPDNVDIERIVEQTTPQPASKLALIVFLITLNRRFLSILIGSNIFIIAIAFGIEAGSVSSLTVLIAAVIGPLTQLAYQHPFVSAGLGVLNRPEETVR